MPLLGARRADRARASSATWLSGPVLVGLLAATAGLVLAHVANGRGVALVADRRFSISYEGGYAELLAQGLALVAAALLLRTWRARREPVDVAWTLTFVVIALDDGLQIHERAGRALVDALGLPAVAGLRAQDLGELGTWAAMGVVVAAGLLAAHRASGRDARRDSRRLLVFLVLLVLVSVVGDMGGQLLEEETRGERFFAILDDGGELVGLSALVAVAVATWRRELALSQA